MRTRPQTSEDLAGSSAALRRVTHPSKGLTELPWRTAMARYVATATRQAGR